MTDTEEAIQTDIALELFCPICGQDTPHYYAGDQGNCEVYTCANCGQEVSYAVR